LAALATRKLRDSSESDMSSWRAPIDVLTLLLIMFAGIELGVIGLFGFSIVTWLLGSWHAVAYDLIGFSAIWQLGRQRISD
jgi:uncharacterized membrane protein YuzA (DUF378 family)